MKRYIHKICEQDDKNIYACFLYKTLFISSM
jgi:hypothetical protein